MSELQRWTSALRWSSASQMAGVGSRIRWADIFSGGTSDPVVLPIRFMPGASALSLIDQADTLASFYRCAQVEVVPDLDRSDRALVVIHRRRLPPSTPYPVEPGAPWELASAYRALPLGVTAMGAPFGVKLFGKEAGGSSLLVGGVPGTGKTTVLRTLLAGLATTPAVILVIDPTGGAEAALWRRRLSALVADAEYEATVALLNDVVALVERRGRLLGAGLNGTDLTPVVLVCDELAELGAAGTPRQQDEVRSVLRRIVALGRKANVAVVLATQRTTSTSIDVTTRSLVNWRIALAHPDDVNGSEALLGPGRRQAASLRRGDVGAGYVTDGGEPVLVRIHNCTRTVAVSASQRGLTTTLDHLGRWENEVLDQLTS